MLLAGINHVAVVTDDTERFHAFYREVFDADVVSDIVPEPGMRLSFVAVGPETMLNVFQAPGEEAVRRTPMLHRGGIDHMGLAASSQEAFDLIRNRLMACGASDGFVTDFGSDLSVFFVDPDGLEGEVLLKKRPEDVTEDKGPGNPAAGYEIGVPK